MYYWIIKKDVKTIPVNDDQVFVFEDLLYQVLLTFSRDTQVLKSFSNQPVQPFKFLTKAKGSSESNSYIIYPPNGFLPYEGFSMLGMLIF